MMLPSADLTQDKLVAGMLTHGAVMPPMLMFSLIDEDSPNPAATRAEHVLAHASLHLGFDVSMYVHQFLATILVVTRRLHDFGTPVTVTLSEYVGGDMPQQIVAICAGLRGLCTTMGATTELAEAAMLILAITFDLLHTYNYGMPVLVALELRTGATFPSLLNDYFMAMCDGSLPSIVTGWSAIKGSELLYMPAIGVSSDHRAIGFQGPLLLPRPD
jgi:uncharacterized membrane protein YhaH (DUF805 family)